MVAFKKSFKKAIRKIAKTNVRPKSKITRKPTTKMVKSIVRREISKNSESKMVTDSFTATLFNSGITSNSECYPAFPAMYKGTGSNARVGDEVKGRWLILNGMVRITNTATMPEPKYAFIYVLEDKRQKDCNAGGNYQFLNDNGAQTNFDGTFIGASRPLFTEKFKLHRRIRVKLTQQYAPASLQTGVVDQQATQFRYFKVRIWLKNSTLMYDASGAYTLPENRNIFFAVGYTNYSNAVDVALQNVEVSLTRTLYYRD